MYGALIGTTTPSLGGPGSNANLLLYNQLQFDVIPRVPSV